MVNYEGLKIYPFKKLSCVNASSQGHMLFDIKIVYDLRTWLDARVVCILTMFTDRFFCIAPFLFDFYFVSRANR